MLKYADVESVAVVKEWLQSHPGSDAYPTAARLRFLITEFPEDDERLSMKEDPGLFRLLALRKQTQDQLAERRPCRLLGRPEYRVLRTGSARQPFPPGLAKDLRRISTGMARAITVIESATCA